MNEMATEKCKLSNNMKSSGKLEATKLLLETIITNGDKKYSFKCNKI